MTMHLLPVYYTSLNTRKRKRKNKTKSLIAAEQEHQKFLKRMGVGKSSNRSVAQSGSAPALGAGGHRFKSYHSDQLPSWNPSMTKQEKNTYTGTEIIGIAQMHKSNAVPVRGKQAAIEVAKMRRG
tara:strand:- start:1432 stop:1806 length:375 start_codon:yes stop_codon:yes gene_type:complete